jgi:hypothetical protein
MAARSGEAALDSRGLEDQAGDFPGVRDHGEMTGRAFDGVGVHALCHESLQVSIDGAVLRRHFIEGGFVCHAVCVVAAEVRAL